MIHRTNVTTKTSKGTKLTLSKETLASLHLRSGIRSGVRIDPNLPTVAQLMKTGCG
jgi:hypothetical protein